MTYQAEPTPSANAPVLYFSAYDSRCSDLYVCLYRSGIDGANPELLGNYIAHDESTWHPAPSPDGSKVAFVTTGAQIKVFDYATKTLSAWSVTGDLPAWSPDGTQIAFAGGYGGPLRVINADGTNQRSITIDALSEWEAAWSPDSKWIIALDRSYFAMDIIEVATGKAVPMKNVARYTGLSWK
jgi:Tol biopolymer transport system component